MKEYNHKTKRWEVPEKPMTSLKKPETCKGKKPHNFVLCLDKFQRVRKELTPEEIEEYYRLEEARMDFEDQINEKLAQFVVINRRYVGSKYRYYKCSVCGKEIIK